MFGDTRPTCVLLTLLCAALYLNSSLLADGVVRDGLGAISIGRGGTNIAHSDNGAIVLDNPAGMVNVDGCGLVELSFDTLFTDLHYTDPQNDVDAVVKPYPLGELAFVWKNADVGV